MPAENSRRARLLPRGRGLALLALSAFTGCATQPPAATPFDPWERVNRPLFAVAQTLDRTVLRPVARGYRAVVPSPVRAGVANVYANLRGVDSALNGFLQGKPRRGFTDTSRFLLNSTLGLGGLFDPATAAGLVAQDEDFGQTLAVWGVRRAPYLYLPVIGPSSLSDLGSLTGRIVPVRLALGDAYNAATITLQIISERAVALAQTDIRDASAMDVYAFTREAYWQRRRYQIFDGRPPDADGFEAFTEVFAEAFADEFVDEPPEEPAPPDSIEP